MSTTATSATISKASVFGTYALLNKEGKMALTVVGNPTKPWVNPKLKEASKTYKHSYIINFKAIEARKFASVMLAFGTEEVISLSDFNFNLTKEIIVHEGQAEPTLPISGEVVDCNIAYALNKEGGFALDNEKGDKILEVRSMNIKAAEIAPTFGSFAAAQAKSETAAPEARQEVGAKATTAGENY